jgi:hypothetical protein
VEDVLDDAQRLAEAARHTRSRTAIADPATGGVLAVEQVDFRRPAPPGRASHVLPLQRGAH